MTQRAFAIAMVGGVCLATLSAQRPGSAAADPARAFFAKNAVVRLELTLAPADRERLRDAPRQYVPVTLQLAGEPQPWRGGGVKLKGAAGSFQKIDERPGFTVNLDKFGGEHRLAGLRRFHLNNGAQDSSRLSEWLGAEVFRAAGYPAPRVAHAHVVLDGEPLGIYVLREGYDEQFLQRVIGNLDGNLYDGGFCRDVDQELEKDAGGGPDDRRDLRQLLLASRDFDAERVTRFERSIDVDALIDFVAIEAMLGHWDGYSHNRNNFRLWIGLDTATTRFLPHGMDQLFGQADASILRHPSGIVARAVMQHPDWRKRYRERLRKLLPLFAPRKLESGLDAVTRRIGRELGRIAPDAVDQQAAAASRLAARVRARYRSLRDQVRAPEPEPLAFPRGRAQKLREWRAAAKTDNLELDKKGYRGVTALRISSRGGGNELRHGIWRTSVLLARGRYRFAAAVRCEEVAAPAGEGVLLAVGDARGTPLVGTQTWSDLTCEFEVEPFQDDIELEMVLRASAGRVWFRLDSVQLEKIE